jgi:large subunit ribosomal protein L31
MQKAIHPEYHSQITATCACGASFIFGSIVKKIQTEICSNCHPFYTGKQKLVDTAGKVDKFRARAAKAITLAKKKTKISKSIKVAAATKAIRRTSATDSARAIRRVKDAATKREFSKAVVVEEKKNKEK